MGCEIRIARTDSEKERIFRFRYKVYIEEMNRPAHADHDKRMITDWLDDTGTLIYAVDNGTVVGTVRVNLKRHGDIEFENEYDVRMFNPYYPKRLSSTTKFMVDPKYRGGTIMNRLIQYLYAYGLENGIYFDFINVNEPLFKFYSRLGYRSYKDNFHHPEFGEVVPMVLAMNDRHYLETVKSPLARFAAKYAASDRAGEDVRFFYREILGTDIPGY
ncbi:GCN5-related N-acetyltransferase [Desulfonatronospira thiodismutans ASO3-1]|uniref:GCN5-related N-acetyltransferase n=1 Tax=Desulfonatronospira thiodismutans ASO3-1 TaxID=555779 RepID=D6STS2_9BACT|nr:GNAT family N-acetyltransferase [Desulfonatronospira thiodismutans]EFI34088.1 GCN5-related N-acetyltransferase [Desulfonatronospira thiodismutans ASO3-1]